MSLYTLLGIEAPAQEQAPRQRVAKAVKAAKPSRRAATPQADGPAPRSLLDMMRPVVAPASAAGNRIDTFEGAEGWPDAAKADFLVLLNALPPEARDFIVESGVEMRWTPKAALARMPQVIAGTLQSASALAVNHSHICIVEGASPTAVDLRRELTRMACLHLPESFFAAATDRAAVLGKEIAATAKKIDPLAAKRIAQIEQRYKNTAQGLPNGVSETTALMDLMAPSPAIVRIAESLGFVDDRGGRYSILAVHASAAARHGIPVPIRGTGEDLIAYPAGRDDLLAQKALTEAMARIRDRRLVSESKKAAAVNAQAPGSQEASSATQRDASAACWALDATLHFGDHRAKDITEPERQALRERIVAGLREQQPALDIDAAISRLTPRAATPPAPMVFGVASRADGVAGSTPEVAAYVRTAEGRTLGVRL